MNVKIFGVLSVLILALAVWFFYQEGARVEPALPARPDVSYEVSQIKAVQTNEETGEVEYTLTAASLVQNAAGEDEMLDVLLNWQPPKGEVYTITAKRATLNQSTGELLLSDGFVLTREATDKKLALVIEGGVLSGNTKTHQLWSDEPLTVNNGKDSFKAANLKADLAMGNYEFGKVEVVYQTAK